MAKYNDWAGLCKNCKFEMFTGGGQDCPSCGRLTNSDFKRCATCAKKQNKCSSCDKELHKKRFKKPGMGALPPPNRQWTIGLTVASTEFVDQAETRLVDLLILLTMEPENSIYIQDTKVLRDAIEQVKSKKVVLTKRLSVDDFLKTGKLPK